MILEFVLCLEYYGYVESEEEKCQCYVVLNKEVGRDELVVEGADAEAHCNGDEDDWEDGDSGGKYVEE